MKSFFITEGRHMQQVGDQSNNAQVVLQKLKAADDLACYAQVIEAEEANVQ